MGLFQKAYETYEANEKKAGIYEEGMEPLAPVSHIVTSAKIEITVNKDGKFVSAELVDKTKEKTIIPVTEESAGRSGKNPPPHPLCDKIAYVSPADIQKYNGYKEQLTQWVTSPYSHPMLLPILKYVEGKTIMSNLEESGITKLSKEDKIRWRVIGLDDDASGYCHTNKTLFKLFEQYYMSQKENDEKVFCMVTGKFVPIARQHLKGVVSVNGNAKLISANDKANFTYRGRFKDDAQAVTVGYEASQKAHNALKWLLADQATIIGTRAYLCWNPKGKEIPKVTTPFRPKEEAPVFDASNYKAELSKTLLGYKSHFLPTDDAVVAVFDAATNGRLAFTYYAELPVYDFLERLEAWDETCCFKHNRFGIQSPSLEKIVRYVFGTPRNNGVEVDDRVKKQQLQRLFECRAEGGKIPYDFMRAIDVKSRKMLSYPEKVSDKKSHDKYLRDDLLFTACAVIRKYYIDHKKEEFKMSLEKEKFDISYQYGRLLAVLEKAERDTYEKDESRDPNAIRMQAAFSSQPAKTAKNVIEQLKTGYLPKLKPGARVYYDKLIGEIYYQISLHPENTWNMPLKETYIIGYYLQKNELYTKKDNSTTEDENNDD